MAVTGRAWTVTNTMGAHAGPGEETMTNQDGFDDWVASIERGGTGFTYIRFFSNAPGWVRNEAIARFGKGTVFLPPRQPRHLATGEAA